MRAVVMIGVALAASACSAPELESATYGCASDDDCIAGQRCVGPAEARFCGVADDDASDAAADATTTTADAPDAAVACVPDPVVNGRWAAPCGASLVSADEALAACAAMTSAGDWRLPRLVDMRAICTCSALDDNPGCVTAAPECAVTCGCEPKTVGCWGLASLPPTCGTYWMAELGECHLDAFDFELGVPAHRTGDERLLVLCHNVN